MKWICLGIEYAVCAFEHIKHIKHKHTYTYNQINRILDS